jgi:hypothetical protein
MTEKREDTRARVELWKVARSSASTKGSCCANSGRYSIVDSDDAISTTRTLLFAWSSVYGRAYDTYPAFKTALLLAVDVAGLATLLMDREFGETPADPESKSLRPLSGMNEIPDCRISSIRIKISDS